MVSEDSQDFRWLAMVHRLGDFGDLNDPLHRQVFTLTHQGDDLSELVEVLSLRRSQAMLLEKRNDYVPKIGKPVDIEPREILSVIVVPMVHANVPASKKAGHLLKNIAARH